MRCQAARVRRAKVAVGTGKGLHLGLVLLHVRCEMTPPRRGELAVLALKRILIPSVHETVGNGLPSLVGAEVAVFTLVPFRIRHDDSCPSTRLLQRVLTCHHERTEVALQYAAVVATVQQRGRYVTAMSVPTAAAKGADLLAPPLSTREGPSSTSRYDPDDDDEHQHSHHE